VVRGLALTLPDEVTLPEDATLPGGAAPALDEGSALEVGIRAERCILRRLDPDRPLPPNCFVALVAEDLAFGNAHLLRLEPEGPGPTVLIEVASRPYEVLGVASQRRWVVELPPAICSSCPSVSGGRCDTRCGRGPDGRRRDAHFGGRSAGGKSGLHRTGCRLTAGRREPTESATETYRLPVAPSGAVGR
jgi:hypothetical protein